MSTKSIGIGAIVRHTKDKETGVLQHIVGENTRVAGPAAVGDWVIHQGRGMSRVTSRFDEWELVPLDEQSHAERYWSYVFQYGLPDCDSIPQPALEFILYGELGQDPEDAPGLLLRLAEVGFA